MSEKDRQKIEQFKSIACDASLTDDQVKTYLSWGKGKIDVALNYYYNRIQKGGREPPKEKKSTKAQIKLREGAQKEKRTQDYIKSLKNEYKLPLQMKEHVEISNMGMCSQFDAIDYIPDVLYSQGRIECEQGKQSTTISCQVSNFQRPSVNKRKPEPATQSTHGSGPKTPITLKDKMEVETPRECAKQEHKVFPKSIRKNGDVLLGEFVIGCFAVSKMVLQSCKAGDSVQISILHLNKNDDKKGKRIKRKMDQKVMMRVTWSGREIGRVEDSDTKFLSYLLDRHIRLETTLIDKLELLDHFKTFRVKAAVYLMKSSITAPIVETYQNSSDHNQILETFGQVRENFMTLFSRLGLKVIKQPMIRLKSRYTSSLPMASKKTVNSIIEPSRTLNIQHEKSLQQIRYETVNNPFRLQKQTTITDMLGRRSTATPPRDVPNHDDDKALQPLSSYKTREVELKPQTFVELIDLHEEDLEQANPSNIFISRLHEYQSLALSWMLKRQGHTNIQQQESLHPMWLEYELPGNLSLYFNEFTGQISTESPIFKSKCKGGILADEMGLGKTVMLIALMATNRCQNKKSAKNLIVLPLTLLEQWQSQINLHTKAGSFRILRYYDSADRQKNLLDYDVVLTTYGIISQEFSMGNHVTHQGLYKHEWFRAILDEAHYIKGRVIQTARAVFSLRSQINWCLTGTPIQNKLEDLFSLIHFIRFTPWSDYTWWSSYINRPHEEGDPVVFEILRTILRKVMLRRTKQSRKRNGQPIILLPEKTSKICYITLSPKERDFYNAVYESSKSDFDELDKAGVVEAKFMKIFEILMRLRQICCHPALFKSVTKFSSKEEFPKEIKKWLIKRLQERNGSGTESRFEILVEDGREVRLEIGNITYNEKHLEQVQARIAKNPNEMCSVCLDPMQNPVITVCLHTFCKSCIVRSIETIGYCPQCRNYINRDDFMPLPRENRLGISFDKGFQPSSKMQALMLHIKGLEPDAKAVVFSQFLGMIDLIEEYMKKENISYVVNNSFIQRMDGSLSQKERSTVIDKFKNDPRCRIFIISLKSGGVGLNLVVANRVFLVDPWWNPAVEEQAIERVHRIGQKRKVEVVRLIVENSIESRMMELHEGKRNLSAMAMSDKEAKEGSLEKFRYLMSKY